MERYTIEDLELLVKEYPWWHEARITLYRLKCSETDWANRLVAHLNPTAVIAPKSIDITKLTHLSSDDLIERFLKCNDYRIVAQDGEGEDVDLGKIEDEEDMVSEELAEIYANQGLYEQAIETYRKLSLLNSEKSVYFAGLIAKIEDKINNN